MPVVNETSPGSRLIRIVMVLSMSALLLGFLGDVRPAETPVKPTAESVLPMVRFGISTDDHLKGGNTPSNLAHTQNFVGAMQQWQPDFVINLGDFACQCDEGETTPQLHDCQLEYLKLHWALFSSVPGPAYIVMGNHDVGWIEGGDEVITPEELYGRSHGGEDITKAEFLAVTKMPGRYYSFDVKGYHFIVLDGNNEPREEDQPAHDGLRGGYSIDETQKAWLAQDLAANRDKLKIVFSHQELHHTPVEGSGEGGDVPFPPVSKEGSYVGNGWQIREMLAADGKVIACFNGHKHRNRWVVYGGVNYITLAAQHDGGAYAMVAISQSSQRLHIKGRGKQSNYTLPLPGATAE